MSRDSRVPQVPDDNKRAAKGPLPSVHYSSFKSADSAVVTRPVEIVTGVLMACLERGCLRSVPLPAPAVAALVRCIVPALDRTEALTLLATALWAALQVPPPPLLFLCIAKKLPVALCISRRRPVHPFPPPLRPRQLDACGNLYKLKCFPTPTPGALQTTCWKSLP